MKIPAFARTLSPTAWLISAALVLVLLIAGWWLVIGGPAHDRKAAAQAKVNAAMSDARTTSAAEATETISTGAARDAATDRTTQEAFHAIDKATGADQRLDLELNRAGRRGLCQYAAGRQLPECLQRPGSEGQPASR